MVTVLGQRSAVLGIIDSAVDLCLRVLKVSAVRHSRTAAHPNHIRTPRWRRGIFIPLTPSVCGRGCTFERSFGEFSYTVALNLHRTRAAEIET